MTGLPQSSGSNIFQLLGMVKGVDLQFVGETLIPIVPGSVPMFFVGYNFSAIPTGYTAIYANASGGPVLTAGGVGFGTVIDTTYSVTRVVSQSAAQTSGAKRNGTVSLISSIASSVPATCDIAIYGVRI